MIEPIKLFGCRREEETSRKISRHLTCATEWMVIHFTDVGNTGRGAVDVDETIQEKLLKKGQKAWDSPENSKV